MKIKDLISVLSKFPAESEVTLYRDQHKGLEGFWKNLDVSEQFGFYLEDDDGYFEPIDPEDETYGRNIKFLAIR